jgi:glycosyltransferase involved in cell wall biosynthesis
MARAAEGLVLTSDWKDLDSVTAIGQGLRDRYADLAAAGVALRFAEVRDHSRRAPLGHDYAEFFECLQREPPAFVVVTNGAILRSYFFRLLLMVLHGKGCALYLHLYGDFLRQADLWLSLEGLLRNQRVRFLVPSRAYDRVVRKTLLDPDGVRAVPFSFEPRDLGRDEAPVPRSAALVFLYVGRLSRQKNVAAMIDLLEALQEKHGRPVELWLAGGFDDFEPLGRGPQLLGTRFAELERPSSISVVRWGHLPRPRVAALFPSADVYLSLSTFYDDDFCLAAVEALCAGLPAVLSRWGGHVDLLERFPDRACGVSLTGDGHFVDRARALAELERFLTALPARSAADGVRDYFSRTRVSGLLRTELETAPPPFVGFAPILRRWRDELRSNAPETAFSELYEPFQGRADELD